jgi:hypothetical protein
MRHNGIIGWLPCLHPKICKKLTEPTKDETLPPKIARPMGRDSAKKQQSSSNSSNSTCLEVLQKMQVDRTAYEERVDATPKDEVKGNASRADRKLNLMEQQVKIQ